jgi:hypothetical protein
LLATIKESFFAIGKNPPCQKVKFLIGRYQILGAGNITEGCYYRNRPGFATKKYAQTLNFCDYRADSKKCL